MTGSAGALPHPDGSLLQRIEDYYDAVPRGNCDVEDIGPFTLFVARSGWPYYARPRLGAAGPVDADDVRAVLDRQQRLGVPRKLEWVDEVTPLVAPAVQAAGLEVSRMPLLALDGEPVGDDAAARMLTADDTATIAQARAAVSLGFQHGGTASGPAGIAERERAMSETEGDELAVLLSQMASGRIWMGAVWAPGEEDLGPVGGGSYAPVAGVAEIAGVAVLPAYRRRGLAAQLTCALARHALGNGVTVVFCSAQSDPVARVYEGVGFRRIATACAAEATTSDTPT